MTEPTGSGGTEQPTGVTQERRPKYHPEVVTFGDYVVTLLPWGAYILGTHVAGSWKYGFILGSGVSVVIVLREMIKRESRFMDVGTLLFCLVMTVFALYDTKSILKTYNLPLSLAFVGVLSFISLLLRSPFTYRCHRDHLPEEVVGTPRLNEIILRHHVRATAVWAVSEFTAGGLSALLVLGHHGQWAVAVQILGTLIPIGYTRFVHHQIHTHESIRAHPAMLRA